MIYKIIYLASSLQVCSLKQVLSNATDVRLATSNLNQDKTNISQMNLTILSPKQINASIFEKNSSKLISQNTSSQQIKTMNASKLIKAVVSKTIENSSLKSNNKTGINDKWKRSKWGESKQEIGEEEWKREESFDGEFDTKYPANSNSTQRVSNQTVKAVNNKSNIMNFKNNAPNVSSYKGKINEIKQNQKNKSETKVIRVDLKREEIPLKSRDSKNLSKNKDSNNTRVSKNKSKEPVDQKIRQAENLSKQPIPFKNKVSKNIRVKSNQTKEVKKNIQQFIPLKTIEPINFRPKWQDQKQNSKVNSTKKPQKKSNAKKQKNLSTQAKKKKSKKRKNHQKQKVSHHKIKQNKTQQIKTKEIVNQVFNNEPFIPIKNIESENILQKNKIFPKQTPVSPLLKTEEKQEQNQSKKQSNLNKKNEINQRKTESIPVKTFGNELLKDEKKIKKNKKVSNIKSEKNKIKKSKIRKQKMLKKQKSLKYKVKKQKTLKKISSQQKQLKYRNKSERVPIKDPFKRQITKEKKRIVQPNPDQDFAPNKTYQKSPKKQNLKKKSFKKSDVIVPLKGIPHNPIPIKDQKAIISKPAQIKREIAYYEPSQDESVDIIKITGTTYIPVVKSHVNIKHKLFLFKQKTYVPNKNQEIIIIGGRKYMAVVPLKSAQPKIAKIYKKNHLNPVQNKRISSSNKNKQYVPIKTFDAPVKVNPKISIKINDNYFVPIENTHNEIIEHDGVRYVPVKEIDDSSEVQNSIKPNEIGYINVLRINGKVYIPLSAIPKKYRQIFKNKKVNKAVKKQAKKQFSPVAKKIDKKKITVKNQSPKINNLDKDIQKTRSTNYIPLNDSSAEPIKIDGKTYIPVIKSPENKLHKVLQFNGNKYFPIKNRDPIIIGGRKYLPVIVSEPVKPKNVMKQRKESKYTPKQIKTLKSNSSSFEKSLIPVKNLDSPKIQEASKKVFNISDEQISQPIKVKILKANPKPASSKFQKKQKKSAQKSKTKKYDPVPIKKFDSEPIQIDGKTLIVESKPVKIGDHFYIPCKLKELSHNKKEQKVQKLEIKKNKAFKINGVYYKTIKNIPVVTIGTSYYIPVKILETPLIQVEGKFYIPLRNGEAKPQTFQGKTYIPVQEANEEQIESSIHIVHQKKIQAIRIGKITYIPVSVIPKSYQPVYKKKRDLKQKKWANQPRLVIKINNKNYVPITNCSLEVITFNNIKYIPVYLAPQNKIHQLKTVVSTKKGKIETIEADGITYIPIHVIPHEHRRDFKPKKRILPSLNPVIMINNSHFVPINHNKVQPVEIEGQMFIPLKQANANQIKKSKKIYPKRGSQVETITIGGNTFIPLNIIPEFYAPIFKKKLVSLQSQSIPTHAIKINNQDFIPLKYLKSIDFNGVKYFPVEIAHEDIIDELQPVKPTKKGKIAVLKSQNVTYIPASVIPKAFRKVFEPVNKPKKIVLLIEGNHYVPIHNENVQPITIKGIQYFLAQLSKGKQTQNTKILASRKQHQILKIQIGKQTYTCIPIEFLPQKYRKILKKKQKFPNYPTHSIQIDSRKFVPITNKIIKPIFLNGKKYIPVYTAPKKSFEYLEHVKPAHGQKVDILKILNIHYIPEEAIPKEYIKIFEPVKRIVTKPCVAIKVEEKYYFPIQGEKLAPVVIQGETFIPARQQNKKQNIHRRCTTIKTNGKVQLIKIGNASYLPLLKIPEVYRELFKKNLIIKNKKSVNIATHVIKINDISFVPVTNKVLEPVVFNGIKHFPVYQAHSEDIAHLAPVQPIKEGFIHTLNLGNVTYIPIDAIPKKDRNEFKPVNQVVSSPYPVIEINKKFYAPERSAQVIDINGTTYFPIKSANEVEISQSKIITPKSKSSVEQIKLGKLTYIPTEQIPKAFRTTLEKKAEIEDLIANKPFHSIKVNNANYVPITNRYVKTITFRGAKYIPVYDAPSDIDHLKQVQSTKKGKVQIIKFGRITYIPALAIPKRFAKAFKPAKTQIVFNPIIKFNGANFIPSRSVEPIQIDDKTYISVQKASARQIKSRKTIQIENGEQIQIIVIGEHSFILLDYIPKIFRSLMKKRALTGKILYYVSPQEAAEFEKYYLGESIETQKKANQKTQAPVKVKITQSVPKVKKVQAKPKVQKKIIKPIKKSKNSQNKVISKPILKIKSIPKNNKSMKSLNNKSIPTIKKPEKSINKVNIQKEIQKLEELINRKYQNSNETVPIIRKENLSKFKVNINQESLNKTIIAIDKNETKQECPIQLKWPVALKQVNSSQAIQQNCKCNLSNLNITTQACLCEGQNAKVKISVNSTASKATAVPLSLIISNKNPQILQTQVPIDQKIQMIAPISQIIKPATTLPISNKSLVSSTTKNHVI